MESGMICQDFPLSLSRTESGLTKMQKEFESYIFIASSIPSMVIVVIHAFVGNRFSVRARSVLSLTGIIVTFSGIIGMDTWT